MKSGYFKRALAKILPPGIIFSTSLVLVMFSSSIFAEDRDKVKSDTRQQTISERGYDFTTEQKTEFKAFREEMRQATKDMTPVERRAYVREHASERMKEMSPEQREKVQARMQQRKRMRKKEMHQKFRDMPKEERRAMIQERMAEKMKGMSPEQKERFQAQMERRMQMLDKIKDMSPEERKLFRETRIQEKMKGMTPAQREKFEQRLQQWQGRRSDRRGDRNGGAAGDDSLNGGSGAGRNIRK